MRGVKITNHAMQRFRQRYKKKFGSLPRNIAKTIRFMLEKATFKKENRGANIYRYSIFEFVVIKNRVITFVIVE